jgi:general stress protein 26
MLIASGSGNSFFRRISFLKTRVYVSLADTAQLVRDRGTMQELWKPELKAWFPHELDEPNIALLKVAATTGEAANSGEQETLNLG